ncbi:MAG: T9SS type A sorting domain-containing protein [Draconibacterium sp.]|nr:T9SS type A sorting domain-containing protein [Draconibacterium sp.]
MKNLYRYLSVLLLIMAIFSGFDSYSQTTTISSTQNGNWNDGSTWAGGVVPGKSNPVIITHNVDVTGYQECYSLSLNEGQLQILPTGSVVSSFYFSNNAIFIIRSSATGTGNLKADSRSGSGTATIERYIPSTNWHIISSPVAGQNMQTFAANNGLDSYSTDSTYDLGYHDEISAVWKYETPTIGTSTPTFTMAKGYTLRRSVSSSAGVVTFTSTGGIYAGDLSIATTRIEFGWNCLGNPYTSSLEVSSFISTNAGVLDLSYNCIYLWDQSITDYTPYSSGTTIAIAQGFFVKSRNMVGDIVNFKTYMQTNFGTAVTFKEAEIPWPAVSLTATANELRNETTVNFNSQMTNGLDPMYDLGKFKGNPNIALYTRLLDDNGIDFSVQALPDVSYDTLRIPVGLDFAPGGEVTFTAQTVGFPDNSGVFLEDTQLSLVSQLNIENGEYKTDVIAENEGTGRFNLLIVKYTATASPIILENNFKVSTQNKQIYINGTATTNTHFKVYSVDGKIWFNVMAENLNHNKINASHLPIGVYILQIENAEHTEKPVKFVLQ